MKERIISRVLGGSALVLTAATCTFNGFFAFSSSGAVAAIQLMTFVDFAVNILAIAMLTFLITYYTAKLSADTVELKAALCWRFLALSASLLTLSLPVSLVTLIWIAADIKQLHTRIAKQAVKPILVTWFTLFGLSVFFQVIFVFFLGWWTKRTYEHEKEHRRSLDLDFGIGSPAMVEARPTTRETTRSFHSQDVTLTSPPKTPTTPHQKSSRPSSASTKVGPDSSRTKLIPNSAKSSFDFPTRQVSATEDGFDRWDTSSVHHEVRAALQSSPPVTRAGLETIPGSRPDSPATALDGPFLPSSPHANSSDAATAVDWNPSSRKASFSSLPSSPPNFSRPTSRQRDKPPLASPMEELVHPLFRSTSPNPAPIAAPGTMITASPMAGQPITPRTLSRMRSGTVPAYTSGVTFATERGSNAGSTPGSPRQGSSGPGSPGPSIAEEQELPPILPGFVLSAGQRSSLVGYGQRKSVKERPRSEHSYQSQ